jgi:K+-transporting ATPase A subunit
LETFPATGTVVHWTGERYQTSAPRCSSPRSCAGRLALAIAGSLAGARVHARTRATLDTAGPTFAAFLLGVIVIVGGLIYFPMLILGPVGERIAG